MKQYRHIAYILLTLLLLGGVANKAWATDVTYHILTLPIDNRIYHMKDEISDKRLEAFKVTVTGQSRLELPAAYKSPLVGSFTYYAAADVTQSGSAVKLFDATNNSNSAYYYTINGGASAVSEGTSLSGAKADYYVVYTYNASNTIAQLNGSVKYNIKAIGYDNKGKEVEKGFFAYNRGRNNRPAVLPKGKVDPEMLASEDFMKVDVSGTSVSPYWSSGDNKNKQAITGSKFHFMFEFIGNDPYNIIIRTAYAKDTTYIEKNDNSNNEFVYKYYKEGSLFSNGTANTYFASDEHRHYNYPYNSSLPDNPTNLTEGSGTGWDARTGYYHGQKGTIWNSFALLKNSESTYLFMATRTVGGDGSTPASPYFLKEANTCNNLVINQVTPDNATNNLTIEGLYPVKKLTFKVVTPFGNVVSVEDQVSQYTVDNNDIETKYLPDALKRKYCEFNGKFYKDAACTQEITKFSQADYDNTEGYKVYVGYTVSPDAPKFLSPSASYTTATWYELTDDGSVQESGRKIKNNSGTYKNNGANGEYVKESEFALVGDPYELKVLYREGSNYVTLSAHDTWEMPSDDTSGSFLLREYNGTGYWSWNAGHVSADVTYGSDPSLPTTDKNAQTVILNISGLNTSKYYRITAGGTDASQIVSVTPAVNDIKQVTGTTMTVVVKIAENTSGADKTMTLTFQQYDDREGNTAFGSASDITINQGTASSSFAGNTVTYSTTSSTRVKVLELPIRTYTYKIVDKSGRIAVKASAEQPIFSTLSLASIPSIIVSPFLVGETLTFYKAYSGPRRTNLSDANIITETPDENHDIFVKYTTENLNAKPIKLSEDQEFNVVLNGQYIYYNSSGGGSIMSKTTPTPAELQNKNFLWKLRNRDPYAMLIDNLGAREALSVAGESENVTVYEDNGSSSTQSRQKGAWVDVATIENAGALSFTTVRADVQRFVAKASTATGVYEVMVATGADVDASSTYYNIGRPTENTVKIYYNNTESGGYAHGNDVLKFRLEQTTPYTYHLIDKAKHELLTQTSQSPDLALPADYQSPLVETYHYYAANDINIVGDVYTVKPNPTPLTILADLNATYTKTASTSEAWGSASEGYKLEASDDTDLDTKAKKLTGTEHDYYFKVNNGASYYQVHLTRAYRGTHIYVTYDVNDIVSFNDNSPYTMKFLEPFAEGYYLEDGADKLTAEKHQAVYPYTNGDGNLNIYSEASKEEQFGGGSSTRPRWIWYFDTSNNKPDPYHVRIRARSTISYGGVSHPTYLTTYAVHFNQDTEKPKQERIVTGGTLPTISSTSPMEYMILGAQGAYKLMTTNPVAADLDGDGNTTGTGENERRKVTSLEQYWKTYNMAKLHILGISASTDAYSEDASTWVVPDDQRDDLEAALVTKGIGAGKWHSYTAYANATRWNGYNDKSSGHEKKVVEKLEHWYQTFEMGNGTFDIESAEIPPVLVLLDLHGWEIMRLPLPTTNYPEGDKELAALRAYDSPMVKEYKFYSNATKASGCHKYTLRMQNGAERDQIKKADGEHYTSKSLGDLPPITATGVKSGNEFNDQFVTYTVKDEYAQSYKYTFTDNGDNTYTESGTASKYLVLLASRFFRDMSSPGSSYNSKPIYEASNPVGGNVYDVILDPQQKTEQHKSTSVDDNKDGNIDDINLWYMQPNLNIDKEMGIKWGSSNDITSAEPLSEYGTKKKYKDITGFDPYNIQLKNANTNLFVTSHITSTRLHDGIMIGDYTGSGGSENVTLVVEDTSYPDPMESTGSVGYDHTNIAMTNQTFMAVSDANGNMQLMPRFDHTKRVNLVNNAANSFSTLQDPVDHEKASADDNSSMGAQTVFFVRPERLEYHIIDNEGKESLRYKRAGDEYPAVTKHFQSPLAKDFTYYTGFAEYGDATSSTVEKWTAATGDFKRTATTETLMNSQKNLLPTAGTYYYRIGKNSFTYKKVTVTKGLGEKKIEGALAAETLTDGNVYVRYEYDAGADHDADQILGGKWFTIKLNNKDVKCGDTDVINTSNGTGVSLFEGTGKAAVDEDDKTWQWKFLVAPTDPSSEYYVAPDPYDVQIFSRKGNYATTLDEPSPMSVGIKVPNSESGADHFALLSHTSGGYALAVAGLGTYTYKFLNGANMTTPEAGEPVAATTVEEASFTQKAGIFDGVKSQLLVNDDVQHNFEYKVINNASKIAISVPQNDGAAEAHGFAPYLPDAAQTPLLRMKDYKYYGSVTIYDNETPDDESDDTYTVVPQTKIFTLNGLYDDKVYVRYDAYHVDSTEFKIPNKKMIVDSHVAKDPTSVDVSLNIKGELPYNIIWYNDNMMRSTDDAAISDGSSQNLSGNKQYVWYITGNDPYALKIKHKGGNYVDGDETMATTAADAKEFMLLKKSGYDYGILQETAGTNKLTFGDLDSAPGTPNTCGMTTGDPTKFIIFGLSVHDLIYRLVIAKTCTSKEIEKDKEHTIVLDPSKYVDIPYMTAVSGTPSTKRIYGSTQRDLESIANESDPHKLPGDKYQLGETLSWNNPAEYHTYCHDAGAVSIGDDLTVPNVFNRPNCTFEFYIAGIFDGPTGDELTDLEAKYKGLKLNKLMSDADLIDETVVVNIVYKFNEELATNNGMDFVRSIEDKCWYTFETQGDVPYLAHYTNAWGLQSMEGRETRYTNDYLWTPVGDVYGFKLYNRYMIKNSDGSDKVMTFDGTISEGKNLAVAKPGSKVDEKTYTSGNEVFELLTGDNPNSGYFRVHPVVNNSGTQYYVWRDPSATPADHNYAKLSTTPSDWTFGLSMELMAPYYERAGYVGGLTAAGKTAYETAVSSGKVMNIQKVVYDDANIINFTKGYYRLHNQPDVSDIDPVRYASGYLHDIEKTAVSGGIPMHFYSRASVGTTFGGTEGLGSGFTETIATRGEIPVDSTEYDPSTIFYLNGDVTSNKTISEATMSTQGLYVQGRKIDDAHGDAVMIETDDPGSEATKFTFIDIGGAVFLITDVLNPETRSYLNFDQTSNIYDLKFMHDSPTDDAKWCLKPVQKTATAGNGEMPLNIKTNKGGDGYYYATFCAPFDVLLPDNVSANPEKEITAKDYYAYVCDKWDEKNLHPTKVPVSSPYTIGKFVPAGTPVIIRTNDETGSVTLSLPNSEPSSTPLSCVFSGSYLEKKLDALSPARDVYTLGLPMTSDVDKDGDYVTSGGITAPRPEFATNGVGFYINATPNKEVDPLKALWKRNNLYVLHNKIYYREPAPSPSPAPQRRGPEFVPVIFDDEEEQWDMNPNGTMEFVGDGCIYDLMGRKVATREQVEDGSWKQRVATGIYILNGKKFQKK